jgi:hypothetical protein
MTASIPYDVYISLSALAAYDRSQLLPIALRGDSRAPVPKRQYTQRRQTYLGWVQKCSERMRHIREGRLGEVEPLSVRFT